MHTMTKKRPAKRELKEPYEPAAGDVVEVTGHRVGEAPRLGEILEVIGEGEHRHYRVRWDDGHESVYYPSSDATIRPPHVHGT
jgi:Domain of unknown function (DUF1918)